MKRETKMKRETEMKRGYRVSKIGKIRGKITCRESYTADRLEAHNWHTNHKNQGFESTIVEVCAECGFEKCYCDEWK
jgi:hypothetical protein